MKGGLRSRWVVLAGKAVEVYLGVSRVHGCNPGVSVISRAAGGAAAAFVAGGAVSRSQCDTTGHRQGPDTIHRNN